MSNIEELAEKVVILETEKKTSDREIKELKNKVENLTTLFNGQALITQSILSKVDNLAENFNSKVDNLTSGFNAISAYIEDLKKQPKIEMDKFKWLLISGIVGIGFLALALYLGLKK